MMRLKKQLLILLAAASCLSFSVGPACSFEILGRVINKTTGQPLTDATIGVVNPSGGMLTEKQVNTRDDLGHFLVEDLDDSAPIYLLRISYKGVNYTEIVRVQGQDQASVEMYVYEPVASWNDVSIAIPHFVVTVSNDTLNVDKFIEITNNTEPPKTVSGSDIAYTFAVPQDVLVMKPAQVSSMGVPLPLTPQPMAEEGYYAIQYPMRPGLTRISMSLALPYGERRYTYREKLKHDIQECVVLVGDESIQVTSNGVAVERQQDTQGFPTYRLTDLKAGSEIALEFAGGSTTRTTAAASQASPSVVILPTASDKASLFMMGILILALLAGVAYALKNKGGPDLEAATLDKRKSELLTQLAKLEDLFATDVVSEPVYREKKEDLVRNLAQIYYNATHGTRDTSQRDGENSIV